MVNATVRSAVSGQFTTKMDEHTRSFGMKVKVWTLRKLWHVLSPGLVFCQPKPPERLFLSCQTTKRQTI